MRALATVLFLATALHAEETPPNTPASDARGHYQKATALFNLGEFADAASEYKEAYKSLPEPVFLYNIAQAYRLAGDLQKAAFFYTSYARNAKDPATKREAELRAKKLEAQLAGKKPPETKVDKPEPEAARAEPAKPADTTPPKADPKVAAEEPKNTKPVAPASAEEAAKESPGPAWPGSTERLSSMTDLIKTHRDQFRFCYDAWSKKHPNVDGHVKLTLMLQPDGKLETAEAHMTGVRAPELERCIIAMSKQLTYPPSATGKMTRFNYPFEFKYHAEPVKQGQ
jgi:tetratricopeptide (TPR) repeat protein